MDATAAGRATASIPTLTNFPPLAEPATTGGLPRSGVGVLDGEAYRYAIAQFDDSKVEGAKGLVLVGFPIDDGFAARLRAGTGSADVTLLQKGKILGSTLPPAERTALQQAAAAKASFDFGPLTGERFALAPAVPPTLGHLPLGMTGHRFRGLVVPMPAGMPPDIAVIASVKTGDAYADVADAQRSLLLGAGLIVLLCLLLALFSGNPAQGLSRVVSGAERIVQGEYDHRVSTLKMTPLVRRAAVAINTLANHAEAGAKVQGPALAQPLGVKPGRFPVPVATLPDLPDFGAPAPAEPALGDVDQFLSSAPALRAEPAPAPPEPPYAAPSPVYGSEATQPPYQDQPAPAAPTAATDSALGNFLGDAADPVTLPQKAKVQPSPAPVAAPATPAEPPKYEYGEFSPDETVVAQTPQALIRATQRSPSTVGSAPPSSGQPAANAIALPAPANSEESHFQQVYREFVATREKCGEPADGLTYDRFAAKLRKNQEQLVTKYACRTVRFQVYVKEGKAALKATPVK